MAKTLIIYYSLDGNTRLIAETISKELSTDVLELKPVKEINNKGSGKFLWGGRQVYMRTKPDLHPLDKDPNEYDLLIIGTPVWAWSFTPALRSFFRSHCPKGKKIAIYCCHEGGPGKTLAKMEAALEGNQIIGRSEFFAPLKKDRGATIKRAVEWASGLEL